MAVPAPALPSIAAAAGTAGPVVLCLRCCCSGEPGEKGLCMEPYLRFHQAKTLTGNCKNRTGKLKKVLPLLFPLNMFFQHLECLALETAPASFFSSAKVQTVNCQECGCLDEVRK